LAYSETQSQKLLRTSENSALENKEPAQEENHYISKAVNSTGSFPTS